MMHVYYGGGMGETDDDDEEEDAGGKEEEEEERMKVKVILGVECWVESEMRGDEFDTMEFETPEDVYRYLGSCLGQTEGWC